MKKIIHTLLFMLSMASMSFYNCLGVFDTVGKGLEKGKNVVGGVSFLLGLKQMLIKWGIILLVIIVVIVVVIILFKKLKKK